MLSLAVAASIDSIEWMPGVAAALVHFSCRWQHVRPPAHQTGLSSSFKLQTWAKMKREVKGKKRGKLTLFGVWRHLFHESDEVEQELGVVVGQFQIIAILPGEQTKASPRKKKRCHATFILCLILTLHCEMQHKVDLQKQNWHWIPTCEACVS